MVGRARPPRCDGPTEHGDGTASIRADTATGGDSGRMDRGWDCNRRCDLPTRLPPCPSAHAVMMWPGIRARRRSRIPASRSASDSFATNGSTSLLARNFGREHARGAAAAGGVLVSSSGCVRYSNTRQQFSRALRYPDEQPTPGAAVAPGKRRDPLECDTKPSDLALKAGNCDGRPPSSALPSHLTKTWSVLACAKVPCWRFTSHGLQFCDTWLSGLFLWLKIPPRLVKSGGAF